MATTMKVNAVNAQMARSTPRAAGTNSVALRTVAKKPFAGSVSAFKKVQSHSQARAGLSVQAGPLGDTTGFSPEQIEFLKRKKGLIPDEGAAPPPTPAPAAAAPSFFDAPAAATPAAPVAGPPARVVPEVLPKIYVYDHCPFCVRVRLALGLKNIKHEVVFMANDDVPTPTNLVGKKVAPILERTDKSLVMNESLDIIKYFDESSEFGPTGYFKAASGRTDIKAWQKSVKDLLRSLHRPRYMMAALPEFQQKDSRDYFVFGHPVPPYDKPEWKDDNFGQAKRWDEFAAAFNKSPELIPELNKALKELDEMIYCEEYCTEGGLSYDDIDLWARLRSVTLVKGAVFPDKLKNYMQNLSLAGDMPLYYCMAC